jgi:hypothetical protein
VDGWFLPRLAVLGGFRGWCKPGWGARSPEQGAPPLLGSFRLRTTRVPRRIWPTSWLFLGHSANGDRENVPLSEVHCFVVTCGLKPLMEHREVTFAFLPVQLPNQQKDTLFRPLLVGGGKQALKSGRARISGSPGMRMESRRSLRV